LWGDRPPDTAATAIQVHVSQLRKALGRDVIVTQTPGYMVRVRDGELDLERFERSVAEAQSAPPEEASVLLRRRSGCGAEHPSPSSTCRSRAPPVPGSTSNGWPLSSSASTPISRWGATRNSCPSSKRSCASTRSANTFVDS
jgi:hypothetical protein